MNVIFTLEAGNADFPFLMSDYHLPILPAQADGTIDPNTTDGCGPFRMDNIEFGVRADYTRHDGYWKEGLPYFDAIEQILIFDDAARQNALISGEVDYIDAVDLNTVALLERAPGINVLAVTGTQHYGFPMDTRAAPFDDVNVRLALKYAINRQQMVDTILNGYGTIGNDHPIGPSQPFFNTELEQKEYDPDRARFHLSEAGLDSLDVDINLADAAFAGAMDAGVLFSESAAAGASTSTSCASPTTATGPTSGCRSPSPAPTGAAVRRRTGCSPPPMPRAFRGTRPTGRTSGSTSFCSRRAPNSTRISARRCTSRCSRSARTKAGSSSRCSPSMSVPIPTRWPIPTRSRATGATTATGSASAGGSPPDLTMYPRAALARGFFDGAARAPSRNDTDAALRMGHRTGRTEGGHMSHIWIMIAQRLGLGLVTLFVVSLIIFLGTELLPGDFAQEILGQSATPETVAALRERLGLNDPMHVRYINWLSDVARGDLGESLANGQSVSDLIGRRLGNTLSLALYAAAIAVPLSLALGILAALFRNSFFDRFANASALTSISFPEFFVAYILIFFLAGAGGVFPSMANFRGDPTMGEFLYRAFLPALTLTLVVTAHMMRMTRAAIINLLASPYIEMARLKGMKPMRSS
jgi:peptide/nickel transport system permease protein